MSLSNYKIEKKIGKGQFSEVFRAEDTRTKTIVALKRVPLSQMTDEKARDDCIHEINLLKSLNHPNIIRCLESFLHQRDLVIVLELADAGDLGKMIQHFRAQNKPIPEKTIWKYFSQISSALAHMHGRRVMHRDIKPANIFITTQGVVKMGDLGLGRFFSEQTNAAFSMVGTPYYLSPERIHEAGYDFKSDIWSLGCLLYEMAALQSPFYGDKMNLYLLCQKIDKLEFPPLDAELYSKELRKLVTDCMKSVPAERPSAESVHQVAQSMYQKLRTLSKAQEEASTSVEKKNET